MKKLLSLLLISALVLCMCSCGDTSDASGNATDDDVKVEANVNGGADKSADGYITYDDLTRTEFMTVWPDDAEYYSYEIDCPEMRFDSSGWGIFSEADNDCSIVVSGSERPIINRDISLEDAFLEVLNDEYAYRSTLRSFEHADYGEITPETEAVTLDCGKEAIKFTGITHEDNYGTESDCDIYGYCVFVGGAAVIVSSVIFEPDKVDADRVGELQDYVDRMVNTIRIKE